MTTTGPVWVVCDPGDEGAAQLLRQALNSSVEYVFDADGKLVWLADCGALGEFGEYVEIRPRGRRYAEECLWLRAVNTVRAALLAGLRFRVEWGGIRKVHSGSARMIRLESRTNLIADAPDASAGAVPLANIENLRRAVGQYTRPFDLITVRPEHEALARERLNPPE